MKLTVLGGGGVRSVFLARSLVNRARELSIDKIVFMDNDEEKLRVYGGLARKVAELIDPLVEFQLTTDPIEAVKDADFIITTLRVGQDEARVSDERIALKYGILGQETTGAGGFAMALRSIPVLIEYCKMVKQYSKSNALVFNFTNPSGLVTQALREEGFDNVYGICDTPSEFIKQLARLIGEDVRDLSVECFGLNHLSWIRSIKVRGVERIREIIDNPRLYSETDEYVFEPELVRSLGMLLNEYLYFYYYREKVIENIKVLGKKTRGEVVLEINRKMYEELSGIDPDKEFDTAMRIYSKYMTQRNMSYMSIESGGRKKSTDSFVPIDLKNNDDEGYAGVVLKFIESVVLGKDTEMVLCVPNMGAIEGLRDDDVVEVTCHISRNGVSPMKIGTVPELQMVLIRQVKLYERLAVQAIREKSIDIAVKALMVHPLVNSYSLAQKLVTEYLKVYRDYTEMWR